MQTYTSQITGTWNTQESSAVIGAEPESHRSQYEFVSKFCFFTQTWFFLFAIQSKFLLSNWKIEFFLFVRYFFALDESSIEFELVFVFFRSNFEKLKKLLDNWIFAWILWGKNGNAFRSFRRIGPDKRRWITKPRGLGIVGESGQCVASSATCQFVTEASNRWDTESGSSAFETCTTGADSSGWVGNRVKFMKIPQLYIHEILEVSSEALVLAKLYYRHFRVPLPFW